MSGIISASCGVCFEGNVDLHMIPSCNHSFCGFCLREQIFRQLNLTTLPTCLGYDNENHHPCVISLPDEMVTELAPDLVARFNEVKHERSIPHGDRIYCPRGVCAHPMSRAMVRQDSQRENMELPKLKCRRCHEFFCEACDSPWHVNLTCAQHQQSLTYLAHAPPANFRRCPRCTLPYEKDAGCNHMTCPFCKLQFCFVCNILYVNGRPNCLCTTPMGLFDEQAGFENPEEPQQRAINDDDDDDDGLQPQEDASDDEPQFQFDDLNINDP